MKDSILYSYLFLKIQLKKLLLSPNLSYFFRFILKILPVYLGNLIDKVSETILKVGNWNIFSAPKRWWPIQKKPKSLYNQTKQNIIYRKEYRE